MTRGLVSTCVGARVCGGSGRGGGGSLARSCSQTGGEVAAAGVSETRTCTHTASTSQSQNIPYLASLQTVFGFLSYIKLGLNSKQC